MEPFKKCPNFNTCSANICPLDPEMHKRVFVKGEAVCIANMQTREKLGGSLLSKGLWPNEKEWALAWNNLSLEKKEEVSLEASNFKGSKNR